MKFNAFNSIIDDGTPLDQIAQVLLYRGYTKGLYTPDLMLMLAEPTYIY